MRRLKNYDEDDFLSRMLFLYFSFLHGALGLFIILSDVSKYNSRTFKMMDTLMSMEVWGLIFLLVAICFVLSALQEERPKYISMFLGGLLGSVVFGLAAMANAELASNVANTVNYAIISGFDLIIAIVGGVALWRRRLSLTKN